MRKFYFMLAAFALLAAACSSGGEVLEVGASTEDSAAGEDGAAAQDSPGAEDGADTPDTEEPVAPDPTVDEAEVASTAGGGGNFCSLAADLAANDPTDGLLLSDGSEFFEVARPIWDQMRAAAPSELQGDIQTITAGLDDLQALLEEYDYDFFNEELSAAMESMDTTAMDAAGASFEAYLSDVCGIAPETVSGGPSAAPDIDPEGMEDLVENLGDIDPGDNVAVFMQVFGIDEELAQCLIGEFEDLDPNNIDASMLTQEVCGTTLLEVVSGMGG